MKKKNTTHIHIQQDDDEITGSFMIRGSREELIPLLHRIFRFSQEFKETCTEALLTFDTEAGGKTMNLLSAQAGKEEQL